MVGKEDDRQLIRDAVLRTGKFVFEAQDSAQELGRKAGNEPLSETDLAADALLKEQLTCLRPDYGWLSEETADDLHRLDCDSVWIVDPIDGTRAFLRGGTDYVVSAALVVGGKPTLAAIFAPARNEFYFAEAGKGAWENDTAIHVSHTATLNDAKAVAAQGFLESHRLWPQPWPKMRVAQFNSVALRICLVASGQFDFTVTSRRKREWDLAAADLIVTEAGGKCLDPSGETFAYNGRDTRLGPVVATNALLERQILDLYKRAATQ
jgi:myo-inositol-1(or 4)-monophosphatase